LKRQLKCPNEEVIADYLGNRLSKDSAQQVMLHLSRCERCRDIVAMVSGIEDGTTRSLKHQAQGEEMIQYALSEVKKLPLFKKRNGLLHSFGDIGQSVKDFFTPLSMGLSHPVTVCRGNVGSLGHCFEKSLPAAGVKVQIEKFDQGLFFVKIVTQHGAPSNPPLRVTLKKSGRELVSSLMDREPLIFNGLVPAHYSLEFRRANGPLSTYQFEIKE